MASMHQPLFFAQVVLMADGQVTSGSQIVKPNVKKLRRIGDGVIGGFAGRVADVLGFVRDYEITQIATTPARKP